MKVALSIAAVLLAVTLVRAIPTPCVEGELYPVEGYNTKYIICGPLGSNFEMPCPDGTVFLENPSRCDHPTAPLVCVPDAVREDACELNAFYQCVATTNSAGHWAKMQCPGDLQWDRVHHFCNWANEANNPAPVCP